MNDEEDALQSEESWGDEAGMRGPRVVADADRLRLRRDRQRRPATVG